MEKVTKIINTLKKIQKGTYSDVYQQLISDYPELYTYKLEYYKDAKPDKKELWVQGQINAEISGTLSRLYQKNKISRLEIDGKMVYFISDDNSDFEGDCPECEIPDNVLTEQTYEYDCDTMGITYILKSSWCKGITKPGKSNVEDLDKRMFDLSKDYTYASYNLNLVSYVTTKSEFVAYQIEQGFHKYVSEYRICPENSYNPTLKSKRRTELFFSEDFDMVDVFEQWIIRNYLNDPLKKDFIISTHFRGK
jgi:hypothetical protein